MDVSNRMTIRVAEELVVSLIRQDVHGEPFVEALRLLIVALIEADPYDVPMSVKGSKAVAVAGAWARRQLHAHHGRA